MCALDSVKCGLGVLYLCPPHCNTKRTWPQWILAFGDEGFLLLLCWRLVLWLWGRINLPALPFLYHRKELNYPLRGLFISWLFIPSHWRKKDSRKNNIQYFPLCTGLGKKTSLSRLAAAWEWSHETRCFCSGGRADADSPSPLLLCPSSSLGTPVCCDPDLGCNGTTAALAFAAVVGARGLSNSLLPTVGVRILLKIQGGNC